MKYQQILTNTKYVECSWVHSNYCWRVASSSSAFECYSNLPGTIPYSMYRHTVLGMYSCSGCSSCNVLVLNRGECVSTKTFIRTTLLIIPGTINSRWHQLSPICLLLQQQKKAMHAMITPPSPRFWRSRGKTILRTTTIHVIKISPSRATLWRPQSKSKCAGIQVMTLSPSLPRFWRPRGVPRRRQGWATWTLFRTWRSDRPCGDRGWRGQHIYQ